MAEVVEKTAFLDDRAVAAKLSEEAMNRLIEDFKPFLKGCVAKYSRRYDENQRDELFSSAMLAFFEAIKSYDAAKGHFFPFANRVVNKRIIDHIRKIYRQEGKTVSFDETNAEQQSAQSAAMEEISVRTYYASRRQEMLADEIEQFTAELSVWGITMESLVKSSPKHQKVRDDYREAVSIIYNTPDILHTIQLKRYFPIKAISEITGLPQKKLERARTFIISSLIIQMGDYDYLAEYVSDRRF